MQWRWQSGFLLDAVEEDRRVAPVAVMAGEQRNVGAGIAGLRQTGIDFWRSCWEACQLDVGELGTERCGQSHWDGGLEGGVEAHGTRVWNSLDNSIT